MADDDVTATADTDRAVPARPRAAGAFTPAELERWGRENPEAVRRLSGMPLSAEGLSKEVSREIMRARVGWAQRTAVAAEEDPRRGPVTERPPEFRAPRPLRPDEVQVRGPDGVLYTIPRETYEWLEGERRHAMAWEFIETAAAALAGMPRRPSPTPPAPPRSPITPVERGLARSPAARPGSARLPEPPLKIPPGMSRNEVLESRSRDTYFPSADTANVNQPAVDLIDGKRVDTWTQQAAKDGRIQVTQATVGGRWIQLKRLRPEGTTKATVERRVQTELDTALTKFDHVLDGKDGVSRWSNTLGDGTRLTKALSIPDSLHVSIEVEDLAAERVDALQRIADDRLREHTTGFGQENHVMGVPVTVTVRPAP